MNIFLHLKPESYPLSKGKTKRRKTNTHKHTLDSMIWKLNFYNFYFGKYLPGIISNFRSQYFNNFITLCV